VFDDVQYRDEMHYRYGGGAVKLLTCRNAAGLTAAKLAAKHGHVACAQQLNTLKKLGVLGAAGDVRETQAAAAATEHAGVSRPLAVVRPSTVGDGDATGDKASTVAAPAVSVVPEIVEARVKDRPAADRTGGAVTTTAGDVATTVSVVAALPTARHGNRRFNHVTQAHITEMEPGLRVTGHRVSDCGPVGSSRVTGQCVRPGVLPGFELMASGYRVKSHQVWSGHGSKILTRFHL